MEKAHKPAPGRQSRRNHYLRISSETLLLCFHPHRYPCPIARLSPYYTKHVKCATRRARRRGARVRLLHPFLFPGTPLWCVLEGIREHSAPKRQESSHSSSALARKPWRGPDTRPLSDNNHLATRPCWRKPGRFFQTQSSSGTVQHIGKRHKLSFTAGSHLASDRRDQFIFREERRHALRRSSQLTRTFRRSEEEGATPMHDFRCVEKQDARQKRSGESVAKGNLVCDEVCLTCRLLGFRRFLEIEQDISKAGILAELS
jgi:hypothetical protein